MNCVICGKKISKSKYMNAVLCSSECFHVHFWNEIVKEKDEHIIIDGTCYYDGGNKDTLYPQFLGHSGRRFWIRFKDGRTITTNNLWFNGEIPEKFFDKLPDNAEFYIPDHIKFAESLVRKES